MCGEHPDTAAMSGTKPGSSPHVRGTRPCCDCFLKGIGIIPACAGNTGCTGDVHQCRTDHPRMCGEHVKITFLGMEIWGSSPHVRGTPSVIGYRAKSRGIIPACAGNTSYRNLRSRPIRDHPRMCGEHNMAFSVRHGRQGSSPHVRGTPVMEFRIDFRQRIIPACAGNTDSGKAKASSARDNPRMCGEHQIVGFQIRFVTGSSPHVRGTHGKFTIDITQRGIIPACAGNTSGLMQGPSSRRDHPRMCGEHPLSAYVHVPSLGSSPHVRGTQTCIHSHGGFVGIIPACAGNTRPCSSSC